MYRPENPVPASRFQRDIYTDASALTGLRRFVVFAHEAVPTHLKPFVAMVHPDIPSAVLIHEWVITLHDLITAEETAIVAKKYMTLSQAIQNMSQRKDAHERVMAMQVAFDLGGRDAFEALLMLETDRGTPWR